MRRDKLSGFPYEIREEKDKTIIRFFPKSPTAKYPNDSVLVLKLSKKDKKKLIKILTNK